MKKVIYIIILLTLIMPIECKASYNLEINDNLFKESINYTFNPNDMSIEETLNIEDINHYDMPAFYRDSYDSLNKSVTYRGNKVNIDINYDYTSDNFDNAYFLNLCFDNHIFDSESDYYYIELVGNFSCLYAPSVDINIITDYMVIDTNAVKKGNKYTWTLTDDNSRDVNMYIKIDKYKDNSSSSNKFLKGFRIVGLIILIILSLLTYLLYRKKNSDEI